MLKIALSMAYFVEIFNDVAIENGFKHACLHVTDVIKQFKKKLKKVANATNNFCGEVRLKE